MSWMGSHFTKESMSALKTLNSVHCKKCRYRARLQWDHDWFGEFQCGGCGQVFPAEAINKDKWFYKMRTEYPHLKNA
jgi:hypothetical protein